MARAYSCIPIRFISIFAVLGPDIATWNGWNSIEEGAGPLLETSGHRCIGAMAIRIDLCRSSYASIRGWAEWYHRSPY